MPEEDVQVACRVEEGAVQWEGKFAVRRKRVEKVDCRRGRHLRGAKVLHVSAMCHVTERPRGRHTLGWRSIWASGSWDTPQGDGNGLIGCALPLMRLVRTDPSTQSCGGEA